MWILSDADLSSFNSLWSLIVDCIESLRSSQFHMLALCIACHIWRSHMREVFLPAQRGQHCQQSARHLSIEQCTSWYIKVVTYKLTLTKATLELPRIDSTEWRYRCIHSVAFVYWSNTHKPCAIQRPVLIRMKAHFSKASAKCRRWLYTVYAYAIYPYIYVPCFRSQQCGCLSVYIAPVLTADSSNSLIAAHIHVWRSILYRP